MHVDPNVSALHDARAQVNRSLQVQYPLVNMCTRLPQGLQGLTPLLIRTRTFETLTFSFRKEVDAFNVFETVRELTVAGVHFLPFLRSLLSDVSLTSLDLFSQASVTQLHAFVYEPTVPASKNGKDGWEIYNVQEEYMRMGVGKRTKAWRFTDINRDYSVRFTIILQKLSATYRRFHPVLFHISFQTSRSRTNKRFDPYIRGKVSKQSSNTCPRLPSLVELRTFLCI
jgi:hypothetical protein